MKIKKSTNKKIIITIALLLVIAAAVLFVYFFVFNSPESEQPSNIPQRSSTDRDQSEEINKNPNIKDEQPNTDRPAPAPVPEAGKRSVEMVASVDIINNFVQIRGGLNGNVRTDGSCFAELTSPNAESIRKDTSLLQNPNTVDCKTISMPVSDLSPGSWKVVLKYSSSDTEGASREVSFDIP